MIDARSVVGTAGKRAGAGQLATTPEAVFFSAMGRCLNCRRREEWSSNTNDTQEAVLADVRNL
jgi:hypothetical protein